MTAGPVRRVKKRARRVAAPAPARVRMIETTAALLREKGYHATGLAEILQRSGAPRGSLYFHFPGGKEQLACEALRASGDRWKARIGALLAGPGDPGDAIEESCRLLCDDLEASGWKLGCPVATVALEAAGESDALRATCASHFEGWERLIVHRLAGLGLDPETATTVATVAIASVEGALLLARVQRSRAPLERVARALRVQLAALRLSAEAPC